MVDIPIISDEQYTKNRAGLTVSQAIKELRRVEAEEKSGKWATSVENQLRFRAAFLKNYIIDKVERNKK